MKFLLEKLEANDTDIGHQLVNALNRRIQERRTSLFGLMQYLQNPGVVGNENVRFPIPSRTEINKIMKELIDRLFISQDITETPASAMNEDTDVLKVFPDLKSQFQAAIAKDSMNVRVRPVQSLHNTLSREMTLFENGGTRGKYLEMVYQALLCIPPTSIEAERAFSAAGNLCTKLRIRLSDDTLDAFCAHTS